MAGARSASPKRPASSGGRSPGTKTTSAAPTFPQREAYARAFGCDPYELEVAPHRNEGRPPREAGVLVERFRVQSTYDPTYGRPSERNLPAARDAYPRLMGQLECHMPTAWRDFVARAPAGSSLETLYQLLTLRRKASPALVAPYEVGYDRWPVVERDSSDRLVGHCRVPALVTKEWLLIFQVSVQTLRARYTMDGLLVVLGPQRLTLDLEIDGRGHDASWDARRTADIGLPVLRLSEADVLQDRSLDDHLRAGRWALPGGGSAAAR